MFNIIWVLRKRYGGSIHFGLFHGLNKTEFTLGDLNDFFNKAGADLLL
jgi:hypothetical protein